jgi:hypothetical protein
MRLPDFIRKPLAAWLIGRLRAGKLAPHRYGNIADAKGDLYMERGWVIKPRWWTLDCSARVHRTVRSDADRHMHDHPWFNISILLEGRYFERMPVSKDGAWRADGTEVEAGVYRSPGDIVFRRASSRHRLEVLPGEEAYSLFIMGPWQQVWGFYTGPGRKVEWRTYLGLPPKNAGESH